MMNYHPTKRAKILILLGIILILTNLGLASYLNFFGVAREEVIIKENGTEPETATPSESEREPIFPQSAFEPYESWDEINQILSEYDIKAEFVDKDSYPINPTPDQREKMRNSLTYFSYALDTYFKNTKISKFLERVEFCEECGFYNWGNLIKIPPVENYEDVDHYVIIMIHEIAHSFSHLETYNEFRLICWKPNEDGLWFHDSPLKDPSCQKDEEAFIPQSLTKDKGPHTQGTPDFYYAATHYDEDLGESITAYCVSPEEFRSLAKKHPNLERKYKFIKTYVFEGKEF